MSSPNAATPTGETNTLPKSESSTEVALGRGRVAAAPAFGFVLAAGAIGYLGFRGGGYDTAIREGFGLAVWWVILLAAAAGLIGRWRPSRGTVVMAALFAALAAWTLLSMLWSESPERTHTEGLRVLILLGTFVGSSLLVSKSGEGAVAAGVLAGITGLGVLAISSRALPDLFPVDAAAEFLPDVENRLGYPVGYWNGLGALMALGVPLALHLGVAAVTPAWRRLGAAALPILGLAIFLTLSRGAILAAIAGAAVLWALATPRGPVLSLSVIAAGLTALLAWASESRPEFADAVRTDALGNQGTEMLALLALSVFACGALGPPLADRSGSRLTVRLPRPRRSMAVVAVALVVGLLVWKALPAAVDEFLDGNGSSAGEGAGRLTTIGGNSRDQFWGAAIDAWQSEPLHGIGAGTWEFWWSRTGEQQTAFARDAHSVFLEALGELGPIGLLLVGGLIVFPVAAGVTAARSSSGPRRGLIAAASAACVAFLISAGIDWTWEVSVVPLIFCALSAIVLPAAYRDRAGGPSRNGALVATGTLAVLLLFGSVTSEMRVADSQSLAADGAFEAAAEAARDAREMEPFSASARVQEALALEAGGDLGAAAQAAVDATEKERVNWRIWLILGRIESGLGHRGSSERAYLRAFSLNPRSAVVRNVLEAEGIPLPLVQAPE